MHQMDIHWDVDKDNTLAVSQWIVDTSGREPSVMIELINNNMGRALAYAWGRYDGGIEVYATGGHRPTYVDSWTFAQAFLLQWMLDGLRELPALQSLWNELTR